MHELLYLLEHWAVTVPLAAQITRDLLDGWGAEDEA